MEIIIENIVSCSAKDVDIIEVEGEKIVFIRGSELLHPVVLGVLREDVVSTAEMTRVFAERIPLLEIKKTIAIERVIMTLSKSKDDEVIFS